MIFPDSFIIFRGILAGPSGGSIPVVFAPFCCYPRGMEAGLCWLVAALRRSQLLSTGGSLQAAISFCMFSYSRGLSCTIVFQGLVRSVRRVLFRCHTGYPNAYVSLRYFHDGYVGHPIFGFRFRFVRYGGFLVLFGGHVLQLLRSLRGRVLVRSIRDGSSQGSSSGFQGRSGATSVLRYCFLGRVEVVVVFVLRIYVGASEYLLIRPFFGSVLRVEGDATASGRGVAYVGDCGQCRYIFTIYACEGFRLASLGGLRRSLLRYLAASVSLINILLLNGLIGLVGRGGAVLNALRVVVYHYRGFKGGTLCVVTGVANFYGEDNVYGYGQRVRGFHRNFGRVNFATSN